MAIQGGIIQKANKKFFNAKGKGKGKGKGKDKSYIPKPKNPKPSAKEHPAKDDACHYCKEVGHCKRNCPAYLAELIKKKKQVSTASSSGKMIRKLFPHRIKRATDLLGIIHTDVCGPLRHVSRQAGRPQVWYVFGIATLRALVHASYKTSGNARSWCMISEDAKSWVVRIYSLSYTTIVQLIENIGTTTGISTLVFVDLKSSTQAGGAQSSRVPAPFPEDPYEASSIPPTCHTEESEDSDMSGARSMSSDSTTPLSPDHPLTRTSPTTTPTHASFHRRTARMTVHAQPVMSPGYSARVAKAMALSDLALRKRYRSSYETSSSSSSPALPVQKRYQGTSELILDTDSEEDEIGEEDTDEDEGHGLDDEDHSMESDGLGLEGEEEAITEAEEDQVYSTFKIGQGSGSVLELERPERVSALRQPTLTTWIDPKDGIAYIDIPAYPPPAPPAQTSPSPEWSSGSLPVSPAPFVVPLPLSSPMISIDNGAKKLTSF
ncbi:APOBEC/CMP deaminase [Tanacetum coccineum]